MTVHPMSEKNFWSAAILGLLVGAGLIGLGAGIARAVAHFRALERVVTVKGLSEREVPADIAIWPIVYSEADQDLNRLASTFQQKNAIVVAFLKSKGFKETDISLSTPTITDRQAQGYENADNAKYRYFGKSTITVYSTEVDLVRKTAEQLVELGKQGIAITGDEYQDKTVFSFSKLNELKPAMIEEATKNARAVAEKFAKDSQSQLGKIKSASQGLFSIEDRDSGTPYIKRVRVVSTVEYYLSD